MKALRKFPILIGHVLICYVIASSLTVAHASSKSPPPAPVPDSQPVSQVVESQPRHDPKLVEISALLAYRNAQEIPPGSKVVIASVDGNCAQEVRDALLRRLIENAAYTVLTRDNLRQVLGEYDLVWGGRFDSVTAAKLGKLLGASYFIVGRVYYCGISANDSPDNKVGQQYNVLAMFQVIELETGKITLASANEGKYTPRPAPLLAPAEPFEPLKAEAAATSGASTAADKINFIKKIGKTASQAASIFRDRGDKVAMLEQLTELPDTWTQEEGKEVEVKENDEKPKAEDFESPQYQVVKAAEDLVNGFADRLFARPIWEKLEMWRNPRWEYSNSVHYVKLGHCSRAVKHLEGDSAKELYKMKEADIARYLHNYGVALLCNNNPDGAMGKLRAAYRLRPNQTTLRMLGLAGRVLEWGLVVETNREPTLDGLLEVVDMYM